MPNADRLAAVSGIRVTVASMQPSRGPPPVSTAASPSARCSATTAASNSRCNCCSGAGPIAARQVESTVGEGTACARRHGTAVSSPSSVVRTSRWSASGITVISSTARIVAATLISRRATALIFPVGPTPAAIRSIVPGPRRRSSSCSAAPSRA